MPSKPRWHADIDKIRSAVLALPSPFLDRPAVERLFCVRPRQANNIMRELGGYRIGQAVVVASQGLLAKLDELSGAQEYSAQVLRKSRVVEALDALRHETRPQRIKAPPPRRLDAPLPEGVRISAPGELTISFSSPEDLLGRVMGLAQSAAGDFAAFAAGLERETKDNPEPGAGLRVAGGPAVSSPEES
jgi:hypothetical protein